MKKLKLPRRAAAKPKTPVAPRLKLKTGPLPSAWRLFRTSLDAFLADWRLYVKILAFIAVPSDLLSLSSSISSNSLATAYISIAALLMNVAVLWAIVRRREGGLSSTLAEAYYDGNVALVRYTLVSALLVAMLLPLALGLSLYGASLQVPGVNPFSSAELLVALVSIVLAAPTLWLLVRFGLAPIVAVRDGLRPIAALRRARRATLGRFWPLAGRYVLLGLFLALISIPATLVTAGLAVLRLGSLATVIFEILATLTALPIGNLYLLELYRELERTLPPAPTEPEAATEFESNDAPADPDPEPENPETPVTAPAV